MSNKTDEPNLPQPSPQKNETNLKTAPPPSKKPKQSKWNPFKRFFSKKSDPKISTPSGKIEAQKKEKPQNDIKDPKDPAKEIQTNPVTNAPDKNPEISQKEKALNETKTQKTPKSNTKSSQEAPFKPSRRDFLSKMSELSMKEDLSKLFKDYEQFFQALEKPGENGKSMKDLKEMSDDIERKSDVFVQKVEALCKNEKLELDQRNILTA